MPTNATNRREQLRRQQEAAAKQRRRGREQRGARHAHAACCQTLATHHGDIAIAALVAGMGAWGGQCGAGEPGFGRFMPGFYAQIIQPDLACCVPPGSGEQAGLEGEQAQRVAWRGRALAEEVVRVGCGIGRKACSKLAGVCVQPAGQVHGQHGGRAVVQGLQAGLEGIECVELLQIHIDETLRYLASRTKPDGTVEIDGYPIRRGTTVVIDESTALLWVHGASRALQPNRTYYQGKRRIPAPLVLTRHAGTSDLMTLAEEILGLSKMNFNSFDLYGQLPATIETSRRVARIGALLDRYSERSYDYRLFM